MTMFPRRLAIFLMTTVFAGGAIVPAPVWAAAPAKGGWTTTKVADGGPAGAYCAVSRAFDQTTVTVGRTLNGNSSLALEMKGASLDPKKTYRLSVKAGNADRIEVETKPLNAKTFVLNLDQVVDLAASFSDQPTLQVRYGEDSFVLSLANWTGANSDLQACLSSLSGPDEPLAGVAVAPKSAGTDMPPPINLVKDDPAQTREVSRGQSVIASGGADTHEVARLREELSTLRSTREADLAAAEKDKKAQQDQAMRLATLESENENLRASLRARENEKVKDTDAREQLNKVSADFATQKADLEKQKQALADEVAKLKTEKAEMAKAADAHKADLKAQTAKQDDAGRLKVELAQARADHAGLLAEKNLLQARLDDQAKSKGGTQAASAQTKDLQVKVDKAQAEIEMLRARLAKAEDQPKMPDVASFQRRIETLTAENIRLRGDLASATMPETEMKVSVAAEAPLRQQLRDLRAQNEALRGRADELSKLLDRNQASDDATLIKASGRNWDLEQSTRRLQEAEREVQRLSLSLRDQKTQCEAQKKEIEYMLFDPKLAKEGQIALLNSLEDQIADLKSGQRATASTLTAVPSATDVSKIVPAAAPATIPALVSPPATVAVSVPVLPTTPTPPPAPLVVEETLAAPAPVASVTDTSSSVGIAGLLKQAGIAMTKAVVPVAKNPFGAGRAWAWETDVLAGMAVQQGAIKPAAFDGQVSGQLKQLKTRCKGDFAAQAAAEQSNQGLHYAAYDAACIAGANSTSAAILFYQKDGLFNVISHEAAPDEMAQAMDARDRLITTLAGK